MIKPLESLPIASRVLIGIAAVAAAFFLISMLNFCAPESQGEEARGPLAYASNSPYEKRLIELDKEAIEQAYQAHIQKLFHIWVTDYVAGETRQPRATKGAQNARGAFERSMEAIKAREAALGK